MGCCHELSQGRVPEDGVVWEADAGNVEVDQVHAVVVVGAQGHGKTELPQGAGGSASDAQDGLAGSESFQRYMEEAEGLVREQIEADTTVDEGFGDGHLVDGGRVEHRECTE